MAVHLLKGKAAEDAAKNFLLAAGLTLVVCNYSCRVGEIDIIMNDKKYLVFVEVRFRKNNSYGGSFVSVNYSKQLKLIRTAQYYLQKNHLSEKRPCRFDIVAVSPLATNFHIEWLKNAFEG